MFDTSSEDRSSSATPKKKRWLRIGIFVFILFLLAGGIFLVKAGYILNKISTGNSGLFTNLVHSLPGSENQLKGEKEGRVNILLLGMRGEHVDGGGLLADTIMVLSIHPKDPSREGDSARASFVSVPRDLYVTVPGRNEQRKINAVYALGEERRKGGGIEDMKKIISEVTGLDISYTAVINFKGFTDLVNALGGIDVHLDQPFMEGIQFNEPQVCDSVVFTEPYKNVKNQQMYECKFSSKPRSSILYKPTYDPYPLCNNKPRDNNRVYKVMAQYPLCTNKNVECGGVFKLPAGDDHLDGDTALCYARARYGTSDFDRARRQQAVIQAIKSKALSLGTLSDFSKISALLDSLGDNTTTNMEPWELKRAFELYQKNSDTKLTQKVLENSEEGLLYAPPETASAGYILLPRGDNYDRIHSLFQSLP